MAQERLYYDLRRKWDIFDSLQWNTLYFSSNRVAADRMSKTDVMGEEKMREWRRREVKREERSKEREE